MIALGSQLIVGVSENWDASCGQMHCFERKEMHSVWEAVDSPVEVTFGKKGMAWGRGVIDLREENGLHKKEGDGRSPAGIFSLGAAFGDLLHLECAQKMPFLLITEDLECVDDPASIYYNRFVNSCSIEEKDWKSSEKMQKVGPLYALGVVVQHNVDPILSGEGSAIFIHIWRSPAEGTEGCMAMAETDLKKLVAWIDPLKHPLFVQLPKQEYAQRQTMWKLPEIE